MSGIPKCEMCPKIAEKVCRCRDKSYLCADHIGQHVASSHDTHILEPLNKLLQPEIQVLQNIKLRLNQKLIEYTKFLVQKRRDQVCPLLENIQKIENKFEQILKNVLQQERQKLEEIEQMIKNKSINFYNGKKRLKSLQNREKFQNEAKKAYLESFSFPIQTNSVEDYRSQVTKEAENKLGSFVYDCLNYDQSQIIVLGPVYQKGIYQGGWNFKGQKHGKGRKVYKNGQIEEGYWKNGKKNGKVRVIYSRQWEGDVFEGQYVNGKREGFGVYRWASGSIYEGNWRNDKQHGQGVWTGSNGNSYVGDFVDDYREGFGIYRWADGSVYEGNWKRGKKNGEGTYFDC